MRSPLGILLVLVLLAGFGCEKCSDYPDRDSVTEAVAVRQGELVEGSAASGDTFSVPEDWDFKEDVEDLPPGVDFARDDLYFRLDDSLVLDYTIAVEPWVAPGVYSFAVEYELYDSDMEYFEYRFAKVTFRFRVSVARSVDGDEALVLLARQVVAPVAFEEGADAVILVGGAE